VSAWEVIKMLLPIIVILGSLSLALFYLKKKQFIVGQNKSDAFDLKVLHTRSIMPKKYISMVRLGDKVLVLGLSDNSVTLLKELDWDESYNEENKKLYSGKSFLEIFKRNLQGK